MTDHDPRPERAGLRGSVLPDSLEHLELLHERRYDVRAYRLSDETMVLQGAVVDDQPAGLYADADPDPLRIHHMQVTMEIAYPAMEIMSVAVEFEAHPHDTCPAIVASYDAVVGLSITRGFVGRVRELFGGPRGCSHTTALLQAMAPVAIQSMWAMSVSAERRGLPTGGMPFGARDSARSWRRNYDSCHVWSVEGELVAGIEAGRPVEAPLPVRQRRQTLGLDPPDGDAV